MTRLYWKIFLAFWAVIILTVAITITVNSIVFRDEADSGRINELRNAFEGVSQQAQQALKYGGANGLRGWLTKRQAMLPFIPLLIVDSKGEELLGRPLPPSLNRNRSDFESGRPPRSGLGRRSRLQMVEIRAENGESFQMIMPRLRPRLGGW